MDRIIITRQTKSGQQKKMHRLRCIYFVPIYLNSHSAKPALDNKYSSTWNCKYIYVIHTYSIWFENATLNLSAQMLGNPVSEYAPAYII